MCPNSLPNPEGKSTRKLRAPQRCQTKSELTKNNACPKLSTTNERCWDGVTTLCKNRTRAYSGAVHAWNGPSRKSSREDLSLYTSGRGHHRLLSRSSGSTRAGVDGSIDGVVGKLADSGGVPAMDCSKHSESGGVCFGLLSAGVWLGNRRD